MEERNIKFEGNDFMQICLKKNDIIEIKASVGLDEVGRVFSIKGDNQFVYRNVNADNKEFYLKLIDQINLNKKLQQYIIPTTISNYTNESSELILQHKKIEYVNYPWEWSREMHKSAALMFIDMNIELIHNAYFTKDSHSFNIIFANNIPYFIDFGSLVKNRELISIFWLKEFELFFLLPLFFFSISEGKNYRSVYLPGHGFTMQNYNGSLKSCPKSSLSIRKYMNSRIILGLLNNKVKKIRNKNSQIEFLLYLKKIVDEIDILYPKTSWSEYNNKKEFSDNPSSWDNKQRIIHDIAQTVEVDTVIDLAGNTGFYLDIFSKYNQTVKNLFLFDYDEVCIDMAFFRKKYQVLVVDFLNIGKHISSTYKGYNYELDSIDERIKGDLVLALALTHHLVFWQNHTFEIIAEKLSLITNKYCAVEFIAKEDIYVKEWYSEKYSWYNLENFIEALSKYFSITKIYESNPEHRYIVFCEKN